MFALGSVLISILEIIAMLITVYEYILIVAIIISWVGADPYNPIVRTLRQLTEPLLYRVRKILPKALFKTGLDFTPMIVLIIFALIKNPGLSLLIFYIQRGMGPP